MITDKYHLYYCSVKGANELTKSPNEIYENILLVKTALFLLYKNIFIGEACSFPVTMKLKNYLANAEDFRVLGVCIALMRNNNFYNTVSFSVFINYL